MAAISLDLGHTHLPAYLPLLLPPLHRELTTTPPSGPASSDRVTTSEACRALSSLAQEVTELMKGACGKDPFSEAYAHMQRGVALARERRRSRAALEAVMDPGRSLARKRRKNELKRESKRRHVLALRPHATAAAKQRRPLKK